MFSACIQYVIHVVITSWTLSTVSACWVVCSVSGQFRCARYKCAISACKQWNLCCCDGFCTNLCCANDIVILTGPREQNRGIWVG